MCFEWIHCIKQKYYSKNNENGLEYSTLNQNVLISDTDKMCTLISNEFKTFIKTFNSNCWGINIEYSIVNEPFLKANNNELSRLLNILLNEYLPIQDEFIKDEQYYKLNNNAILLSAKLFTLNQKVKSIKHRKKYPELQQIQIDWFVSLTKELGTLISLIGSGVKHELVGDNDSEINKSAIFESILSQSSSIDIYSAFDIATKSIETESIPKESVDNTSIESNIINNNLDESSLEESFEI